MVVVEQSLMVRLMELVVGMMMWRKTVVERHGRRPAEELEVGQVAVSYVHQWHHDHHKHHFYDHPN